MNDDSITQDDPIREELVAFLDGELDAEAADRVDQRLRTDAQYQKKLQELQRAWDLLDELPRAYVSDSFTQSTVEMVALSAAADLKQTQALVKRQKYTGVIVIAACVLVAAGLGYAVMAQRMDDPNQRLVRDLPVIEDVHLLSVAESTDFLRELEKSGLFNEESKMCRRFLWLLLGLCVAAPFTAAGEEESLSDRRARIESLSPAEKEKLRSKEKAFNEMGEAERKHLRDLHEQLSQPGEGQRLHAILERYHAWLSTLSDEKRPLVLDAAPDKRIGAIKAAMQDQQRDRFRKLAQAEFLTPQDRQAIVDWVKAFAKKNQDGVLSALPPDWQKMFPESPPTGSTAQENELFNNWRDDALLRVLVFNWRTDQGRQQGPGPEPLKVPLPSAAEVGELVKKLSPDTQKQLAQIAPTEDSRREMAQRWSRSAIWVMQVKPPTADELKQFYANVLSDEDRLRIDSMPIDRMQTELERMYLRHNAQRGGGRRGGPGPEGPGRFGGPPPFPPPPNFVFGERGPPPGERDGRRGGRNDGRDDHRRHSDDDRDRNNGGRQRNRQND